MRFTCPIFLPARQDSLLYQWSEDRGMKSAPLSVSMVSDMLPEGAPKMFTTVGRIHDFVNKLSLKHS